MMAMMLLAVVGVGSSACAVRGRAHLRSDGYYEPVRYRQVHNRRECWRDYYGDVHCRYRRY
jgi:hypothetical protein